MRVKTPEHPVDRLATYELAAYRAKLTDALTDTLTGPERMILEARLQEVVAEQEARAEAERLSRQAEASDLESRLAALAGSSDAS
jgi:hypothetical protein